MDKFLKVKILYYKDNEQFEKLFFDKDGKSAYDLADDFIEENKGNIRMEVFVNANKATTDFDWKYLTTFTTMKCHSKEEV
jgi:hypothetical protein